MPLDLITMLFDSQVAQVFNSPFVVPVAGCAMIGSIVVASIWSGVRTREIKSHERLARIAQGLPVEPDYDPEVLQQVAAQAPPMGAKAARYSQPSDGSKPRLAGYILCSIGLGLFVFFAFLAIVLRERDVFSGACAGIIPLAIGIGFLVDASHRRRDYDRWMETVQPAFRLDDDLRMPSPPPPPPPPVPGMSPAQASDWRPLH